MPALYFINTFRIVSVTAIYKDKNEITVCFGFECSSASEGVRAKQNELSVNVGRVDLKLVKSAMYL